MFPVTRQTEGWTGVWVHVWFYIALDQHYKRLVDACLDNTWIIRIHTLLNKGSLVIKRIDLLARSKF